LLALVILFLMAATSHDFWLANLSAPTWKRLHMLVYLAYALLVVHVATGVLQVEPNPTLVGVLSLGVVWLLAVHLLAGWRERQIDRDVATPSAVGELVDACALADIPDGRARIVSLGDERVAIFRYDDRLSALSNVCQHQNGPLGEGRVLNGCVVCPWHGYEYRPETGASPPPFTEKVSTFRLQLLGDRVLIDPTPNPPGTHTEPLRLVPEEATGA
jgi:nitrite reductase/ring-hydroxylating ferredoxin subunit